MIWNNGKILEGSLDKYPASTNQGWIYEVLRVIEGIPVFLPEHLNRLQEASKATSTPANFSEEDLSRAIFEVVKANNISIGNLRLQTGIEDGITLIGSIPHKYPSPSDYMNGVALSLVDMQRENPMVKTWNKEVRLTADQIIREKNVYEVILTTPDGFLLEGSRSNIFGLRKGILYTPKQEYVLPGITRNIVIELAKENYIPIQEMPIHKEELFDFQSFFITGTSPGILPVNRIGPNIFNCISQPCQTIRRAYDNRVQDSINLTAEIIRKL